ncbi:MAG: hypothetical protein ABIQ58_08390 [Candidatus Limnocylindrales bacterium]
MTMQRRPLGQGRTLAALAGVAIVAGCLLRWWQLGRPGELTPISGNAFEGSGIIVFLVGVVTLALVALPYAVGDRPTGIDRPLSFAFLVVVGWLGFGWRVLDLLMSGAFSFQEPAQVFTNGPGVWLAGLGLAILSRAVYQMRREPSYR